MPGVLGLQNIQYLNPEGGPDLSVLPAPTALSEVLTNQTSTGCTFFVGEDRDANQRVTYVINVAEW